MEHVCGYEKSTDYRKRLAGEWGQSKTSITHTLACKHGFRVKNSDCLSCEAVLTPEWGARESQRCHVVQQLLWYPYGFWTQAPTLVLMAKLLNHKPPNGAHGGTEEVEFQCTHLNKRIQLCAQSRKWKSLPCGDFPAGHDFHSPPPFPQRLH